MYWDNGKSNGNYYLRFRVQGSGFRGDIGIMENQMETTIVNLDSREQGLGSIGFRVSGLGPQNKGPIVRPSGPYQAPMDFPYTEAVFKASAVVLRICAWAHG